MTPLEMVETLLFFAALLTVVGTFIVGLMWVPKKLGLDW
jgi:hypothetical protein